MGLQLSMYKKKIQYLPKGISPPAFSVEGVRGKGGVDWLRDALLDLENFHHGFLEECPWLLSEGAGETDRRGLLKNLEKVFFLESEGFCELSFAILMMVRDNELSCCSQARSGLFYFYLQRIDRLEEFLPFSLSF